MVKELLIAFIQCPSLRLAWMTDPFPVEREMFSKEHEVRDASHPLSTLMRGEEMVSVVDRVSVTDARVSVPDEAVKRE